MSWRGILKPLCYPQSKAVWFLFANQWEGTFCCEHSFFRKVLSKWLPFTNSSKESAHRLKRRTPLQNVPWLL